MNYRVYYSFFSTGQHQDPEEAKVVTELAEAVDLIDLLRTDEDIIYIFIEDISSRAHIELVDNELVFFLHLTNGMYRGDGGKSKIIDLILKLDQVCLNPKGFDITPITI